MDQQLTEQPAALDYYFVTHLTNPAQTFFSRLYPTVKKPPQLARKLARGKQLHNFATIWLRTLPEFIVEEGTIDGAWVDVPGVRGKIDYRVGNSILEFKTKDSTPEAPEEIISSYPQDLEQLVFYSVIHPSKPVVNYLVFMRNSTPFDLKAFRVVTKDNGTIKSMLKSRINALNQAFRTEDPSRLGRCRYYESLCTFHTSGSCSCDKLKPIGIDPLQRSVKTNFDADFTKRLEDVRKTCQASYSSCLSTRDIIAPRKHYMGMVSGLEEAPYRLGTRDEYIACLWASLGLLKRRHSIELTRPEKQLVVESQKEPRAWIGFRWLKLKTSVHPQGEIVPYLMKVNRSDRPEVTRSPSSYHLTELGIVCATYGKRKELIFIVYPNLNKLVTVFHVTYGNVDRLLRTVKQTIDSVEEAERKKNLLSLPPPCPSWMNDDRKCPLMKECHVEKGMGCAA